MSDDKRSAVGFANPLPATNRELTEQAGYSVRVNVPAMSGAEPWTASKMDAS